MVRRMKTLSRYVGPTIAILDFIIQIARWWHFYQIWYHQTCSKIGVNGRGRSVKIARPIRSRIAYYYNTSSSRRHQCIIISRSIACEPTSLNVKKFFGFWEVYNVFWQVYSNVRTLVRINMQWCVCVWQIQLQCNTANSLPNETIF